MGATLVRDLMTADVETLFEGETMDLAEAIMNLGRIRHLPVVDREGRLTGLVTHRDILRTMATALHRQRTQRPPEAALPEALRPVESFEGMATQDIFEALTAEYEGERRREQGESAIRVDEFMTRDLRVLPPDATALEAAEILVEQKVGCILVTQEDRLVGILTEADFVKLAIERFHQE